MTSGSSRAPGRISIASPPRRIRLGKMLAAWGVACAAALVAQPLARSVAGLSRRLGPALMGADDCAFTLAILGDLHLDPRDLGTPAPGQPVRWHAWSASCEPPMGAIQTAFRGDSAF